jgi:hypothetical protein
MGHMYVNQCVTEPVVAPDETEEASSEATTHQQHGSPLSWRWSLAQRDLGAAAVSPAKAGDGSRFLN